jgi:hypothetical protein
MIVSPLLGGFSGALYPPRKNRTFKSVQRAVPDSSIVSETPRQVPNFCISKHIAKPFLYGDAPKPQMGVVPLKSLQEFSHVEGASLFNAPIVLIPEAMKTPIRETRVINMEDLLTEMTEQAFPPPFEYNKGIRPSPRMMKGDPVEEPTDPYPTRGPRHTNRDAVRMGTYRLGNMEYDILGR